MDIDLRKCIQLDKCKVVNNAWVAQAAKHIRRGTKSKNVMVEPDAFAHELIIRVEREITTLKIPEETPIEYVTIEERVQKELEWEKQDKARREAEQVEINKKRAKQRQIALKVAAIREAEANA